MNKCRKAWFSGSWYPDSEREIQNQLSRWQADLGDYETNVIAGIVPHAGWYFSGRLAYDVIRRLKHDADVLLILGGHLPYGSPIIHWSDDSLSTPCGELSVHGELRSFLVELTGSIPGDGPDNTIEVQLPLIRAVLGNIPVLPVRVPPDLNCVKTVDAFHSFCESQNLSGIVLGSTDLTHYGMNYGFFPEGSKNDPLLWVRESDGRILEKMKECNIEAILKEAEMNQSACSAGAAAGAARFAKLNGLTEGKILEYDTSYRLNESESFVGYGTVIYGS